MSNERDAVATFGKTEFGRWTVVGYSHLDGTKHYWNCRCKCGHERKVYEQNLKTGRSESCGCLKRDKMKARPVNHGHSESLTYQSWQGLSGRCHNVNHPGYSDYGGRGISVCERWRASFLAFLEDMGERPSKAHSIDRINNDGNYEPCNCRWATQSEQNRNRRNNRLVTHQGETLTLADWAERTGISFQTLRFRLNNGWSVEDALTTPSNRRNQKRWSSNQLPKNRQLLTFEGETRTVQEWAKIKGLKLATLIARLKYGHSVEAALATPLKAWGDRT